MSNQDNTAVVLSIDLLNQISGGVDTIPDLSSLIVYPELYPYYPLLPNPLTPLPTPSPTTDKLFWNNIPFVYPL